MNILKKDNLVMVTPLPSNKDFANSIIAFSLGILKKRTEEKINKAKDKMREDMGEWH